MFRTYDVTKSNTIGGNGNNGNGHGMGFDEIIRPHTSQAGNRDYIEAGKDILDLLMRTNLVDENEAMMVGDIISYCEEFNCQRAMARTFYTLAGRPAVKMAARLQKLQADTGIISPQMNGFRGRVLGRKQREEEADERSKR